MCKIYLACPYSSDDPEVMKIRFEAVSRVAASMMLDGKIVYSPVTHGGALGQFGKLPSDFDYWKEHCLSFIGTWADEVHVLMLDGWQESKGVAAEVAWAEYLLMPITYRQVD